MRKVVITIMLILILVTLWGNNPFGRSDNESSSPKAKSGLWLRLVELQRDLNRALSQNLRSLQSGFQPRIFFLLIGIAFLYGVIHALGPGHGKVLVSAYFLQEKASILSSFKIGAIISLTHSGTAALLGMMIGIFFQSAKMFKDDIQIYMGLSSGFLILILGLVYLFLSFSRRQHLHAAIGNKNEILLGIFSGMVPCPVSLTIILFSIYLDLLWLGLLAVLALSIGMAITISTIGVVTIKTRNFSDKFDSKNSKIGKVLHKTLAILGSLIIITIGVSLIVANL